MISGFTGSPADRRKSSVSWWLVKRGPPIDLAELVAPHRELAAGGDVRVLLAERARRGVARVDEEPLAGVGLAGVERLERARAHVDLAAHLQHVWRALRQALGDRLDGGDVGGDVLPHPPVAAGGRLHETAVLVEQRDGDAVDLQLAHVVDRVVVRSGTEAALQPLAPRQQLLGREGVVERHHRLAVLDRREQDRRRGPDLLARRGRGDELRELVLVAAQVPDQLVELRVGDRRRVLGVVAPVVLGDLGPQRLDPGCDLVSRFDLRHPCEPTEARSRPIRRHRVSRTVAFRRTEKPQTGIPRADRTRDEGTPLPDRAQHPRWHSTDRWTTTHRRARSASCRPPARPALSASAAKPAARSTCTTGSSTSPATRTPTTPSRARWSARAGSAPSSGPPPSRPPVTSPAWASCSSTRAPSTATSSPRSSSRSSTTP